MASNTPKLRSSINSLNVTFLGTASAQPSSSRNHSALALRISGDVWLFDCGEGTQHQLQKSTVKMGKIEKIFITHTHGDHIFGLVPLLTSRLNGAGGTADGEYDPRNQPDQTDPVLEIYGPLGTRAYVRAGLTFTHSILASRYVVHELRFPSDPAGGDFTTLPRVASESPDGRNICTVDGCWPGIYQDSVVSVSAAPILHSIPCVGYVVTELPVSGKIDPQKYLPDIKRTKTPMSVMRQLQLGESVTLNDGTLLRGPSRRPGRKVVILGDTYDPSPIIPIAEGPTILIHEATNSHLPGVDLNTKATDSYESVEARAKSRGHSTPQMAGRFARHIRAQNLVLNHFSARYAGDDSDESRKTMSCIANLAAQEFGKDVICAEDLMSIEVELRG